jgi:hypothetical protein
MKTRLNSTGEGVDDSEDHEEDEDDENGEPRQTGKEAAQANLLGM